MSTYQRRSRQAESQRSISRPTTTRQRYARPDAQDDARSLPGESRQSRIQRQSSTEGQRAEQMRQSPGRQRRNQRDEQANEEYSKHWRTATHSERKTYSPEGYFRPENAQQEHIAQKNPRYGADNPVTYPVDRHGNVSRRESRERTPNSRNIGPFANEERSGGTWRHRKKK